jgi:hypothetical protein
MIKRERRHIDMGFQKIESFFFDIFGCGGGCNIVAPTRSADAPGRSYASLRPIDSVQQNEYYRSQSRTNANANGCIALGGRSKKSQHRKENSRNCSSKEIMIACDEDDDDNSFLNETGTTHPDSFFLDESCSSLSSSIVFDESRIPRVPLQALQDPPKLRPERKLIMIPTETVVGIWPPVVPVTVTVRAKAERMQEQREQLRRLQNPPPPKKEQEPPLPFPIRPPKIRRLTLDDALSIARYPLNSHQQPPSPPRQRFGNHPPCHDSPQPWPLRARCQPGVIPIPPAMSTACLLPSIPCAGAGLWTFYFRRKDTCDARGRTPSMMPGRGENTTTVVAITTTSPNRSHDLCCEERTRQQLLER